MPAASRTTKAIAVTPDVWAYVRSQQKDGEIPDDTLRRLLGLAARERG
jgi:hypothetical protein